MRPLASQTSIARSCLLSCYTQLIVLTYHTFPCSHVTHNSPASPLRWRTAQPTCSQSPRHFSTLSSTRCATPPSPRHLPLFHLLTTSHSSISHHLPLFHLFTISRSSISSPPPTPPFSSTRHLSQETHAELAERMGYHLVEMKKEEELRPRVLASATNIKEQPIRDEFEDLEVGTIFQNWLLLSW